MAPEAKSNPPKAKKRVELDSASLKRASNGSSYTQCGKCNKDIHVALVGMHECTLEAQIQSKLAAADAIKDNPKPSKSESTPKAAEIKTQSKKKAAEEKSSKKKRLRKVKDAKDPNQPKKPPTAFFLFMDDFRKSYKESNPDVKGVAQVGKEGGIKWKSMSEEEKKPYLDKAAELKAEYEKAYEKYQESLKGSENDEAVEDEIEQVSCYSICTW
eukprot:TRINITY_DN15177_c0_g2_i1.p1 TRINITY_DN15177_c0_g2~~TRINITY_DN15177_c0_g2_i1.p1  ORF type:complete len:214 (-),score=51.20 TRINITY_DN15177_c0_g2_i1:24-665(-)